MSRMYDRYGVVSIVEALDEALLEVGAQESLADHLWGSFWDRLSQGAYVPDRPDADDG